MNPLISVVMPVYNRSNFIADSIDSIIKQSYPHLELIIVNDASTDNTAKIIEDYAKTDNRISCIHLSQNGGAFKAGNIGIKQAKGEYYAPHDSDDISHPDRFKDQLNFLTANPQLAMIGSNINIINEQGDIVGKRTFPLTYDKLLKTSLDFCPFAHSSTLIKMEIIKELKGYSESYHREGDVDLWFRILNKYPAQNLELNYLSYRISRNQSKNDVRKTLLNVLRIHSSWLFNKKFFSLTTIPSYIAKLTLIFLPQKLTLYIFKRTVYGIRN